MRKRIKAITWLLTGILACALLFAPAPQSEAFTFWLWDEGYENLLLYTETDPNNRYTVTANKVDVSGLTRDEDAYVYKDKGANFFDDDVTVQFEFYVDSASNASSQGIAWMLSNTIDDLNGLLGASEPAIYVGFRNVSGSVRTSLGELNGGTQYADNDDTLSFDTHYWATAVRDVDAGTYGTIYLYVYSNSNRSTLEISLSLALQEDIDYRYTFAFNCNDVNQAAQVFTGWTQNYLFQ